MPFYRVTIWLSGGKVLQGIREYQNPSIDFITAFFRAKAHQLYGAEKVRDIEAAMLSNHCTAVREYLEQKEQKRKDRKQFPIGDTGPILVTGRKKKADLISH